MWKRPLPYLILGLLLFLPFGISSSLRNFTNHLTAPASSYLTSTGSDIKSYLKNLFSLGQIRDEKQALQTQVLTLSKQLSELETLKRENESLKAELKVPGVARELPKLLSHVIIKGSDPLDRTFTLDVGSNQGVKIGQPILKEGYLVGKILEVNSETSTMRSIFSPKQIIQVWLPTLAQKGYLQGDGNTLNLMDINQGVTVPELTLVETSGLGGTLPQGLLIGNTGKMLSKPSDLSESFRVNPGTDATDLETVFVLLI